MTDIWVILPPNFGEVWGSLISAANIKLVPIFLLLTSHFVFWTCQGVKTKVGVGKLWGGGGISTWSVYSPQTLYTSRQINLYLTQFSTDFDEIMQGVFSSHEATTVKFS